MGSRVEAKPSTSPGGVVSAAPSAMSTSARAPVKFVTAHAGLLLLTLVSKAAPAGTAMSKSPVAVVP